MRRILAAVIGLMVLAPAMPGAHASHPSQICIDAEPDRANPQGPGGQIDRLTVYIGATDDDHEEPHEDGCVISDGADFRDSNIDFEITGAGDPDSADTPETPDLSCTVPPDANHCVVAPPETSGEQTIAAWMDFDNESVELDRDEDVDDEDTDATDVALWTWTGGGGCNDVNPSRCAAIALTIRYERRNGSFKGALGAEFEYCQVGRLVRLRRVRPGRDPVIGRDHTNDRGNWKVTGFPDARGRFYAIAPRHEVPGRRPCRVLSSVTIKLR